MAEEKKDKPVYGEKVVTPVGRVSFPYLDKPDTEGQYPTNKYKVTLLFPKDTDLTPLKQAIIKVAKQKWGDGIKPSELQLPFRDGDEKEYDGYAGQTYITAKTKNKPGITGPKRQPLEEGQQVYGGCYARLSVTPFAYVSTENVRENGKIVKHKVKGVSFALNSVQFIKDGEPFGSVGGDAANDFDEWLVVEDEAEGASVSAEDDDILW